MQPVLIDGGELMPQTAIEIFDDPGVAFHGPHPIISLQRTRAKFLEIAPIWIRRRGRTRAIGCRRARKDSYQIADYSTCWSLGQLWQVVSASASSMIRRMVRAHRPHCALQPRQP